MSLVLIAILLISGISGELSPEENEKLDNLVLENLVFEFDEINTENFSNVFQASLIGVKEYHLFEKGCSSFADCGFFTSQVIKMDNLIVEITGAKDLLPFISPGFKITDRSEALEFEKMLNVIFPVFYQSGTEIYQEGAAWVFVREESFGEKNGIVVTVDTQGTIQAIINEDDIQRNSQGEESGEVE